jgi:molecular chaperone IbpA
MRTNFDFTPYRRSTIGFDRLFDLLEASARTESGSHPPFDIERQGEDRYSITLAIAGFRPDEVEIVAQNNLLTVTGRKSDDDGTTQYLHRGIPAAAFERQFQLADFVVVEGATFQNGLLRIQLKREIPEAMKPRRIAISGSGAHPANDLIEARGEAASDAA